MRAGSERFARALESSAQVRAVADAGSQLAHADLSAFARLRARRRAQADAGGDRGHAVNDRVLAEQQRLAVAAAGANAGGHVRRSDNACVAPLKRSRPRGLTARDSWPSACSDRSEMRFSTSSGAPVASMARS